MSQDTCTKANNPVTSESEICCPCKAGELIGGIVQSARIPQIGTMFQIDLDNATELEIEIGDKLFRFTITDITGEYPDRSGGEA